MAVNIGYNTPQASQKDKVFSDYMKLAIEGGGNKKFQNANAEANFNLGSGINAFAKLAANNNKWTGFNAEDPEIGLGYSNDRYYAQASFQPNVRVDQRRYAPGTAPNREDMFRFSLGSRF